MTNIHLATPLANSMLGEIGPALDAGPAGGTIKVYAGSQPADAMTALSGQTLLATFTLDAAASFGAPSARAVAVDASPVLTATGAAAGTATWFRAADSTGTTVLDGDVSATGGNGDLQLNTTTISVGLALEITGGGFSFPL